MPPPRPAHGESASIALARVAPLISRWVERLLAEGNPSLTLAQYLALEAIDGGQRHGSELAQGAGVSRSAVSQLVASLEGMGLVERREGDADRRLQPLELSREGRRALRASRERLRRSLDPLLGGLPPRRADELARSLAGVEEELRGTAPPRRPPRPPRPGALRPPPPRPRKGQQRG
jgi:DNA-binding MarR family transcriptional regulator